MSRLLSVAHLSAIDLDPPAFIEAAARAGFDGVGLRLLRATHDSPSYPLMDNPAMMRATRAALSATGLRVMDIEFVRIEPGIRPNDLKRFLDAGAELGANHVITAPYDPNLARLADNLAAIDALARDRGLGAVLEFFPWTVVPDLNAAIDLIGASVSKAGILVDALHFDRSNSDLAELSNLPPELLPFAHICDAPVRQAYSESDLLHAARLERLPPGEGDIDLEQLLRTLPAGVPLSAEVPMTSIRHEIGTDGLLAQIYNSCRGLLASVDA